MPPYADLHAHPTGKNFPKYYNGRDEDFEREEAHAWRIPESNWMASVQGVRATAYNQADVGSLVRYSGKLAFASIYPFEEGFVKNLGQDGDEPPPWLLQVALRYTRRRIRFLLGQEVDYFAELKAEWEFLQRKSGQRAEGDIAAEQGTSRVRGIYHILAHRQAAPVPALPWGPRRFIGLGELDQAIASPESTVLVLTVEGMHALSMRNSNCPVEESVLIERIKEIKEWPVFFMTFAHHFDNQLCAHANSLFKAPLPWNPDQSRNKNYITEILSDKGATLSRHDDPMTGFTPLGLTAIKHLLGVGPGPDGILTDDPALGRRILVDTKHMSASSRREFYQKIVAPYNAGPGRSLAKDGVPPVGCLPVLASHSAYSGVETLDEMIAGYAHETDDPKAGNRFNYWNINLSAEDIGVIVQTGGLIGLNLDQRILGILHPMKLTNLILPHKSEKRSNINLIVDNLLGMAEAVKGLDLGLHQYAPDRFSFWNCICLGTDFDGGIDPVNGYSSAADMGKLREDMKTTLMSRFQAGELEGLITQERHLEDILQLFFWDNAYQFLKTHFAPTPDLLSV